MKRIIIDFIPHKDQRYDTCGDWQFTDNPYIEGAVSPVLRISVSETPNWRSSALVAVHELIEALLCKHAGITTEQVDQFDLNWKPHIDESTGVEVTEPGNDTQAPYNSQHNVASCIEAELCEQMGMSWKEHEANLESFD